MRNRIMNCITPDCKLTFLIAAVVCVATGIVEAEPAKKSASEKTAAPPASLTPLSTPESAFEVEFTERKLYESSPIGCLPEEGRLLSERLHRQMAFVAEVEKLKAVRRQTLTLDALRQENSAEHSWHVALMAAVLSEHAEPKGVDLLRDIKMLLIHDIVEIDTGDTFLYDEAANASKAARENECAERIFGLLPSDQRDQFVALWREFEARETPDAKFAASVDRLHPCSVTW